VSEKDLKVIRDCAAALERLVAETEDEERREKYSRILELIRQDMARWEGSNGI